MAMNSNTDEHTHQWLLDDHKPKSAGECMICGERREFEPAFEQKNRAFLKKEAVESTSEAIGRLRAAERELRSHRG